MASEATARPEVAHPLPGTGRWRELSWALLPLLLALLALALVAAVELARPCRGPGLLAFMQSTRCTPTALHAQPLLAAVTPAQAPVQSISSPEPHEASGHDLGSPGPSTATIPPAAQPSTSPAAPTAAQSPASTPAAVRPQVAPGDDSWRQPSEALYQRLQADPELLLREPWLAEEFAAAPWLLPRSTAPQVLPYWGVHDLAQLMAMRAAPVAGLTSAVALVPFDRVYYVMVQNSVYSLAKLGGVHNYVVATFTAPDLVNCTQLNLPCADVAALLAEPLNPAAPSGFGSRNYNIITFLKAALTQQALDQGHTVLVADADVVWAARPIWPAFAGRLARSRADGIFQYARPSEHHNTGTFVILPTPAAREAARRWAALASGKEHDQQGFARLAGQAFQDCTSDEGCSKMRDELGSNGSVALFQTFPSAQSVAVGRAGDNCALSRPKGGRFIQPCAPYLLFVHPVCMTARAKPGALLQQGMWFVDDLDPSRPSGCAPWRVPAAAVVGAGNATLPACQPLWWRQPAVEERWYRCPEPGSTQPSPWRAEPL